VTASAILVSFNPFTIFAPLPCIWIQDGIAMMKIPVNTSSQTQYPLSIVLSSDVVGERCEDAEEDRMVVDATSMPNSAETALRERLLPVISSTKTVSPSFIILGDSSAEV
jgi:hypothetical protein